VKRILLTTTVCLFFLATGLANVIHVVPGGEGEGTSWKDATSLQQALAIAQAGDEIWVAAGTSLPTLTDDRTAAFRVPTGVKLLGGFAGHERKAEKRNVLEHCTILSGEIGDQETADDNSYTILLLEQTDATTLVDGFVITGGYANGLTEGVDLATCGAGVFISGHNGAAAPTISNCTFQDNFAREGAAIYVYAEEGEATPQIRNCEFLRNRADFNGGAIFNDGNYGVCNPHITHCYFEGNRSMYGAGVLNRGLYGHCTPTITECTFTDNFSTIRGGVVYNAREGRGTIEAAMSGNLVSEDNGNSVGDAIDESQAIDLSLPATGDEKPKSAMRIRSTAY
jgi:hypothetical protein